MTCPHSVVTMRGYLGNPAGSALPCMLLPVGPPGTGGTGPIMIELQVGRGTTRGARTVFPLWGAVGGYRRYTMGGRGLDVREVDGAPDVGTLMVRNVDDRPALVLEGQLFEGGWQHRMARHPVMIGMHQWIAIDVACVEQGRWGGTARQHVPWCMSARQSSRSMPTWEAKFSWVTPSCSRALRHSSRAAFSRWKAGWPALSRNYSRPASRLKGSRSLRTSRDSRSRMRASRSARFVSSYGSFIAACPGAVCRRR